MEREPVSRRDFLKIAGIAGATMGMGAGLGGLVAACGEEEETTTTAAVATTAASTTSDAPRPVTTTVSAAAEAGREVKMGVVSPQTGPLAVFGIADKWSADLTNKTLADGLVLGDGKKHPISIMFRDTQSDSNRAAQVAGDMITNDKVDILLAVRRARYGEPGGRPSGGYGDTFPQRLLSLVGLRVRSGGQLRQAVQVDVRPPSRSRAGLRRHGRHLR